MVLICLTAFSVVSLQDSVGCGECTDASYQHGCVYCYHDHEIRREVAETGFSGHFHSIVIGEDVYDANEAKEEFERLHTHTHLDLIYATEFGLSVHARGKMEEHHSHAHEHGDEEHPDGDRIFEKHTLIVEELYVKYDTQVGLHILAGKLNPRVGFAEIEGRQYGVYGYESFESQEIKERIGFAAVGHLGPSGLGWLPIEQQVEVSVYQADRTILKRSIGYERETFHPSDGGLANTHDLRSYSVQWRGQVSQAEHWENLQFIAGFGEQYVEGGDAEQRWAVGATWQGALSDTVNFQTIVQWQQLYHYEGEEAHDMSYLTYAARVNWQRWFAAGAWQWQDSDADEADEAYTGQMMHLSAGYTFDFKEIGALELAAYWAIQDGIDNDDQKATGLAAMYHVDF